MSLRIGEALRVGARRTVTREGMALIGGFVVVGAVAAVGLQTVLAHVFDSVLEALRTQATTGSEGLTPTQIDTLETFLDARTPFALPVPASVGGLLVVLTGVCAEALHLVAARVFVADRPGEGGRAEGYLRPVALPTLNGVVGGLVVGFFVTLGGILGLVLLVVGGPVVAAFLATSFLFLRQEVAVEGKNVIDALNDSWRLAGGHRVGLFGLVLAEVVLSSLAAWLLVGVAGLAGPVGGTLARVVAGGVTAAFGTAVVTRAYAQLRTEKRREATNERSTVY